VGERIVGENPCDKAFENSCQVALKTSPAPSNMKVFASNLDSEQPSGDLYSNR
jgi:hypothetical protein